MLGALAAQARGAVELSARATPQAALAPLRRAWRVWQDLEAPYEGARARPRCASETRPAACLVTREAGMLEDDAARTAFERLGAGGELARLDFSPGGRPDGGRLTPRELEVLRLIADGQTNKGVANELGFSERTVDRHVSNILGKLWRRLACRGDRVRLFAPAGLSAARVGETTDENRCWLGPSADAGSVAGSDSRACKTTWSSGPRTRTESGGSPLPVTERQLTWKGVVTAVLEGGDGETVVLLHGRAAARCTGPA